MSPRREQGGDASEEDATGSGATPGPSRAPLRSDLGFRLGRAHRKLRAGWEVTIADLRVTPPQAAVLRAVTEGEACGLRALARRMDTDVMNLKRLVAHLEEEGLVYSSPDPEHSQRHVVRPTPRGVTVSGEIAARAVATEQRLRSLLGDEDLDRLQELLVKLQAVLADPGAPPRTERAASSAVSVRERNT